MHSASEIHREDSFHTSSDLAMVALYLGGYDLYLVDSTGDQSLMLSHQKNRLEPSSHHNVDLFVA